MIRVYVIGGTNAGKVIELPDYRPSLVFPVLDPFAIESLYDPSAVSTTLRQEVYQVHKLHTDSETFYLAGLSEWTVQEVLRVVLSEMAAYHKLKHTLFDKTGMSIEEFYSW
jgi:hypothetical protein